MGEKEELQAKLLPIVKRLVEILEQEKQAQTIPDSEVERSIKALKWTDRGNFSWAFAKNMQGGLMPEAVPLLDAIHAAGGNLNVEGELFTVSVGENAGKFINRKVPKK